MTTPDQTPERVAEIARGLSPAQARDLQVIVKSGKALVRYKEKPSQALHRLGAIDRVPYGGFGFVVTPTDLGRAVARALDTSKGE